MSMGDGFSWRSGGVGMGMKGQGKRLAGRGLGPSAECICPNCGAKIAHKPGVSCAQEKCPKCGTSMVRA